MCISHRYLNEALILTIIWELGEAINTFDLITLPTREHETWY